PLRHIEDREALWTGLVNGDLDFITTDHCPFTTGQKEKYKDDFRKIPKGIGGVGTLLPLIYSEGVIKGRITLERMVKLLCENPAWHYGFYPKKGNLLPGADADIVLLDPEVEWTITPESTGTAADYTVYDGMNIKGRIHKVIRRGSTVIEDGEFIKPEKSGEFLTRIPG
ncbi:MAG: amidohydrolase family protein, partial [Candidatus Eremiobacteraeota bacterium]|nr:amidohydrolase family protein [Candidatus Eremiobacteraeota bacterium]